MPRSNPPVGRMKPAHKALLRAKERSGGRVALQAFLNVFQAKKVK